MGGKGTTVRLDMLQFEAWYHQAVARKYHRDINRIHTSIRPLLLFYAQLSRLCSHFACSLQGELLSLRSTLYQILLLIDSLVGSLPPCMDYQFLKQFCRASTECISNICTHLHAFSHPEDAISEHEIQHVLLPRIKQISSLLRNHPVLLQALEKEMLSSAATLKFLSRMKNRYEEDLEIFAEQLKGLRESQNRSDEYHVLTAHFQHVQEEYQALADDHQLTQGRTFLLQIERCEYHLNLLTDSLFRPCQQLKNKKRMIKEDNLLTPEEYHILQEFVSVMQRSLLYEHIRRSSSVDEFEQFLNVLCRSAARNCLSLSKKNQTLLEEASKTFDLGQWTSLYHKWDSLSSQAEQLEKNKSFRAKRTRYEAIKVDYKETSAMHAKLRAQFQEDMENYCFFTENFSNFQSRVRAHCLEEFGVELELTWSDGKEEDSTLTEPTQSPRKETE